MGTAMEVTGGVGKPELGVLGLRLGGGAFSISFGGAGALGGTGVDGVL